MTDTAFEDKSHECGSSQVSALLGLPLELHELVAFHLPYPDLLALTLTHPVFYHHPTIKTSKVIRVEWLIDRASQRLPLPSQSRCRWSSDKEFVSHPEILDMIRRRRKHLDCAEYVAARGPRRASCFVIEGQSCPFLAESTINLSKETFRKKSGQCRLGDLHVSLSSLEIRFGKLISSWQAAVLAALIATALWLLF